MSKLMVKDGDIWVPMEGLKGDTGPLPADESIPDTALVTDGAKTNTAYLMRNRLTKDAEGELISVEDAYAVPPLSLSADGVSTQLSTTGKNLLSDVRSEWMRVSGFSGNPNTRFVYAFPMETGASLRYHRNDLRTLAFIAGWMEDPTDPSTYTSIVTLTNRAGYTFTNTNGHAYLVFTVSTALDFASLVMAEAQVEVGTTNTAYERYSGGAQSPRPDWPQDIVSIASPIIYERGKNLLDDNASAWESGATNSYGIEGDNTTRIRMVDYLPLPRETYTWSVSSAWHTNAVNIYNQDKVFLTRFLGTDTNVNTFTMPDDGAYIRMFFGKADNSDITPEDISDAHPMLTLGSTATEYQPYLGVTATLDFSEEPLRSLPDGTKDELRLTYIRPSTRPGWAWYSRELVKRIDTKAWSTGFGQYHPNTSGHPRVRLSVGSNAQNGAANSLCNSFVYNSSTYNYGTYGDYYISGNYAYFILDDSIENIEAANAWLAEHPINLQYKLITPTSVNLDPIELPAMQSGVTNLWSDPSTNLSVTYERDRNIVITNLKAAVADLATS